MHLVRTLLALLVCSATFGCFALPGPLDTNTFACDKRSLTVDPHCIDFQVLGDVNASKGECTRQGGTVLDACPRDVSLGGCKLTNSQTTWYYEDATTKTEADVRSKCQNTGSTFVPR